ncbi:MAG: 3-deoxy-D-manno-octulosonic acid transferase [Candidatus Aminicenantes bacterium]|nr:MAG: 3-deoxy-D-manno-octulosonic acid transferase [Candidatus Aminicenantes bacterium]
MYGLYSILLLFSLIVYFPIYFVRSCIIRREGLRFRQRCGFLLKKKSSQKRSIWIHAVSVGEVLSLQHLIVLIKQKHPDWIIQFSCLTDTGFRIAKEKLKDVDDIFFVPLDFRLIVSKFFRYLKPDVFILAESEFWPNLLREADRKTNGVLLINGRISSRSFRRYQKVRFLINRILSHISLFLVQTKRDKKMLEEIGVDPNVIRVAGNLKAEIELPILEQQEIEKLQGSVNIPEGAKVIVAGSVRKGEEELLLKAFSCAREENQELLLILAPRHPDRTNEVEKICQKYPLGILRRTGVYSGAEWDVLILDTLGELAKFYALSDVAFVGGSLVPWGGHNLLEPAYYAKPIFFGPHMDNFAHLSEIFVEAGAARIVKNKADLVRMFSLQDETEYLEMGQKAKSTLLSLQGATDKTLQAIDSLMDTQ